MEKIHVCSSPNCSHSSHKNRPMVNPHIHSGFSLLDGAAKTSDYIKLAKEYGHPALAITDHGNPAGLYDHYKQVKAAGLKPILGEEFYLALDITERVPNRLREPHKRDKHQTVLIQNQEGYKNFCKLTYLSFTEGYYAKPRIDYDMLFQYGNGLVITSGCAASIFNQLLNLGKETEAEEWFVKFVKRFGANFYGEIQFNELLDKEKYGMNQKQMNDFIIKMSNKYDIPLLIGGDTHYAYKEDAKLQDVLIAAQRRKDGVAEVEEDNEEKKKDFIIHARHLYYHQSEDYYNFNKEFGYNYDEGLITQALDNSIKLADSINFEFETGKVNFPKFNTNDPKKTSHQLLEEHAWAGLMQKLQLRRDKGEEISNDKITEYEKRLDYELEVIKDKQFSDYFLIVEDLLKWARQEGIGVGVGRGSCGGSLLAYALDIIALSPVKYDLYFERFLNPQRESAVDIDLDIENGGREKIRHYLEDKYGKESVLGVVTFHLYGPKSALQDASRGLKRDTSFESTLMKEVTKLPDLDEQKDLVTYFQKVYKTSTSETVLKWCEDNQDTILYANKLLGQPKNLGTHAGGILIAPGPVYDYIPVTRGGGEVVTAFKEADGSSKDLSELGLLKLDVLGLRTLNVINNCVKKIKIDLGVDLKQEILDLDLSNPELFELIQKGNLYGLFQLDGGASPLVKMIKPNRFEDIVAINSLNRPGPLETFGPVYAKWKRHYEEGKPEKCKEDEIYPKLDFMLKATKESYGALIFQEQFMFMVKDAAGFNLGEADNFRRAIAWTKDHPKYYTVKKYFDTLETKMLEKGYSQADVDYFVDYCRKFMGYSFNKSHALFYSYTGMQCVYLKKYYPAYFYAELANVESHEKIREIVVDAIANGINVLAPSVTKSQHGFSVENEKTIRMGFNALKGFGDKAYEELVTLKVSDSKNIYDILTLPFKKLNVSAFQSLIDVGAFDEFGVEREKIESIRALYKDPKIEKWFTRKRKPLDLTTMPPSLLDFPEEVVMGLAEKHKDDPDHWKKLIHELIPFIKVKPLKEEVKNNREENILGFSLKKVSSLAELLTLAEKYPTLNLKSLSLHNNESDLCYWSLVKRTVLKTKRGKEYLNLEISDGSTTIKAKCWDMLDLKKGKAYVSNLKKDLYGYTIINNGLLTEIDL